MTNITNDLYRLGELKSDKSIQAIKKVEDNVYATTKKQTNSERFEKYLSTSKNPLISSSSSFAAELNQTQDFNITNSAINNNQKGVYEITSRAKKVDDRSRTWTEEEIPYNENNDKEELDKILQEVLIDEMIGRKNFEEIAKFVFSDCSSISTDPSPCTQIPINTSVNEINISIKVQDNSELLTSNRNQRLLQADEKNLFNEKQHFYFEKQQRNLCPMHAINNVVQYPLVSPEYFLNCVKELTVKDRVSHVSENGQFYSQVIEYALSKLKIYDINRQYDIDQILINNNPLMAIITHRAHHYSVRRFYPNGNLFLFDSLYEKPVLYNDIFKALKFEMENSNLQDAPQIMILTRNDSSSSSNSFQSIQDPEPIPSKSVYQNPNNVGIKHLNIKENLLNENMASDNIKYSVEVSQSKRKSDRVFNQKSKQKRINLNDLIDEAKEKGKWIVVFKDQNSLKFAFKNSEEYEKNLSLWVLKKFSTLYSKKLNKKLNFKNKLMELEKGKNQKKINVALLTERKLRLFGREVEFTDGDEYLAKKNNGNKAVKKFRSKID